MPLATLAQVKEKLGIPPGDTSDDAALTAVLTAAERFVLERTAYSLTAQTVEELVHRGQFGREFYTRLRPVASALAWARVVGGDWLQVPVDVLDPELGLLAIAWPAPPWPPATAAPRYARWRSFAWDVVRVRYDVAPLNSVPLDLSDATAALAAAWFKLQKVAPVTDFGLGLVRESYSERPVPLQVESVLANYSRPRALWW